MKPSALLAADLHIREDIPKCRTDDYMQVQINKWKIASSLCSHDIPMIIAGDIFDFWKSSPSLLRLVLERMPYFICIPGQHDLPRHNLELINQSNLAVIAEAGRCHVILDPNIPRDCGDFTIYGYPYGTEPKPRRKRRNERPSICLIHMQVSKEQAMFETKDAYELLHELKGYDLILSGDNHKQFDIEVDGRRLVNPGSVMRMDADQIDHQPRFYLWYAEDNSIEAIDIPIDTAVVQRTHIELQAARNYKIDQYIDSMKSDYSIGLDFKKNLDLHNLKNKTSRDIKDIITKWMEK